MLGQAGAGGAAADGRSVGSIVAGAVRANTKTARHMTANDAEPSARRGTLSVKVSANTQTLRPMLTIGSTTTMNGCDMLSGPTCSAVWFKSSAASPVTASAYTGQCKNMPPTPNCVSESVMALMNVATKAHRMAVAAPSNAARRPGEPRSESTQRIPAPPAVANVAPSHALLVGMAFPPLGSDTATKTASETQVRAAAHHVTEWIDWRIQTRRRTRAKTSSVTSNGWTTESSPLCNASAWNTKPAASATQPNSQSGFDTR